MHAFLYLTVSGGFAPDSDGGGGLLVQPGGRATLRNATVAGNQSTTVGGGIANYGTTTILGRGDGTGTADAGQVVSKVDNNSTANSGGGIFNEGRLSAGNVEISYNHSGSFGGGLTDIGNAVLKRARIDHNTAAAGDVLGVSGGGIDSKPSPLIGGGVCSVVIEDSEVSGNTANGSGGGISNRVSSLVLRRSRVSLNRAVGTASQAGGIVNGNGAVTLTATRVTGNSSTGAPGGLASNRNAVTVDQESVIVANRPTNCAGSTVAVPNCFG